ncbi:hypothetical protein R3P38DRAFT_3221814 [Favolaschia claudopus]|uniref:Uncharacterized protein n=1 Tax=Favolaschia claudopus TaxID=2862362 RepID=A0AAW0A043_9AGAR
MEDPSQPIIRLIRRHPAYFLESYICGFWQFRPSLTPIFSEPAATASTELLDPSSRVHLRTENLTVTHRTTSLFSRIFDSSTAKPPHCRTPRDAQRVCLADYGDALPSRTTIGPPASPTCHLQHHAPPARISSTS